MQSKGVFVWFDTQRLEMTSMFAVSPDSFPVFVCGLVDGSLSRCEERYRSFGGCVFLMPVLIGALSWRRPCSLLCS
jgi:hypothetical protein